MTVERLEKQRERLDAVSREEWQAAYLALAKRLLFRLGGYLTTGDHGEMLLKGGKTTYYAHSEQELDENVLHHYAREFLFKLKDGTWEWPEDVRLSQQLENMADSTITHEREKYKRKKEKEKKEKALKDAEGNVMEGVESHIIEFAPERTSFDERYMGDDSSSPENPQDDDGGAGEEEEALSNYATDKYHHRLWEKICEAADGDPELEPFVQATGENETVKDVNAALGLKDGDRDKLQKKLKRRVQKLN